MTGRRTQTDVDLTDRELDCLRLAAAGLTGRETAARLYLSPQTVKFHRSNILRKLGARTTTHAVALAIHRGFLRQEAA